MVVLKRGIPAGFNDLNQYVAFCKIIWSEVVSYLDEIFDELGGVKVEEFVIQGSATSTRRLGDPVLPNDYPIDQIPNRKPDDIEFGILMNRVNFDKYIDEAIFRVRDNDGIPQSIQDDLVEILNFGRKRGRVFSTNMIETYNGENFENLLLDSITGKTNFTIDLVDKKYNKVHFAIVLKGGNFDNQPSVPFKF